MAARASHGAAKETVRVAFLGPLTGSIAAEGRSAGNGARLAVFLHNAQARARYRYDLLVLDDECDPATGVRLAAEIGADARVVAAIPHYCSAVAMRTVEVFHVHHLPVVVWGAELPEVVTGNTYPEIFRLNGSWIDQNRIMAPFMVGLGYRRWVVLFESSAYGQGHLRFFKQFLEGSDGVVVGAYAIDADQTSFASEMAAIKALDPEVVLVANPNARWLQAGLGLAEIPASSGLNTLSWRIHQALDDAAIDAQFQGTGGIMSPQFIGTLGARAEGALAIRGGAPLERLPGGQVFLEAYAQHDFEDRIEPYGPFAFAATTLIMDIVEKVGPDRRKIARELAAVKGHPTILGPVSFDASGQNIAAPITKYVVQDRKWIVWEDSDYATGRRRLKRL